VSYQKQIADAIVTVLGGVTGAPALVQHRKEDALQPREANSAVIVTAGFRRPVGRAFGGTIFFDNGFQVAIYQEFTGDLTTGIDTNPLYVQRAKQALDLDTLSGLATLVRDVDLVDDETWERQPFRNGGEVSRFGLLVRTNEPQNG
jgi:hypothetical protein